MNLNNARDLAIYEQGIAAVKDGLKTTQNLFKKEVERHNGDAKEAYVCLCQKLVKDIQSRDLFSAENIHLLIYFIENMLAENTYLAIELLEKGILDTVK